jgi:hypothetical protein
MAENVPIQALVPVMEEAFRRGKSFRLPIRGTSMLPLLVEGRDAVILEKPAGPLAAGDIPLYRRADGSYVLHRIVAVEGDGYVLCGDNQSEPERGITDDAVCAVVTAIERDGRPIELTDPDYRRYCEKMLGDPTKRYFFRRLRGSVRKRLHLN